MERRDNMRKELRVPVKYQVDDVIHGVLSHDVSCGGLGLITHHPFSPLNSDIHLTAVFSFLDQPVDIRVSLAWVRVFPETEQRRIGLKFEDLPAPLREKIGQFVNTVL